MPPPSVGGAGVVTFSCRPSALPCVSPGRGGSMLWRGEGVARAPLRFTCSSPPKKSKANSAGKKLKFSNITEEIKCHTEFYCLIWLDDQNQDCNFRSSYFFDLRERIKWTRWWRGFGALPPPSRIFGLEPPLSPGCCLRDISGVHGWILCKLLSLLTEMNWLGSKGQKFKVLAWPRAQRTEAYRARCCGSSSNFY